jgi:glycosyltransferase involved in cell wall biosynthesis
MEPLASARFKRLLIVGPKPPPIGGAPLTVQAFLDELAGYPAISVGLINTSPSRDVRKKTTVFNLEKVWRMVTIIPGYTLEIRKCDAVLVFANDLFFLTLVPLLLLLARSFHKPFFLKPIGGSLDIRLAAQKKPIREYMLNVLRSTDGILAQTKLLQTTLIGSGCKNTHFLPGCRPAPEDIPRREKPISGLRLIFLAHITYEKGPLNLLEALQFLAREGFKGVSCDFFGPIHDEIRDEFIHQLNATPGAQYCGAAEAGSGSRLIASYDVLVLPTYFACEGHPGVLIEAMHAGVPVICTQNRTIPELVTNGENGILVPVRDSHALAEAIKRIALDRALMERMGRTNYRRGQAHRSDVVVKQLVNIIFPESTYR